MLIFGDEAQSRRLFCTGPPFLTTRPVLVTVLRQETPNFDDETYSRRQFEERNAVFWRRGRISSPIWGEKCCFLATKPVLVTILRRKKHYFGDETESRRHFGAENAQF